MADTKIEVPLSTEGSSTSFPPEERELTQAEYQRQLAMKIIAPKLAIFRERKAHQIEMLRTQQAQIQVLIDQYMGELENAEQFILAHSAPSLSSQGLVLSIDVPIGSLGMKGL